VRYIEKEYLEKNGYSKDICSYECKVGLIYLVVFIVFVILFKILKAICKVVLCGRKKVAEADKKGGIVNGKKTS